MTTISADMIRHSEFQGGRPIATMLLTYPLIIHAECKTHRIVSIGDDELIELGQNISLMSDPNLSRNASSSRAVPALKLIEAVEQDPFIPLYWGKNQSGMQAFEELTGVDLLNAENEWRNALLYALRSARRMVELGVHKQIVNRLLTPFAHIRVLVTATEWDNFFQLRNHPDAEPHMQLLAKAMLECMQNSRPQLLEHGEWHLPFVSPEEREELYRDDQIPAENIDELLCKLSAARCARTSYLTHDLKFPSRQKDLELCDRLINADVFHASPFEHQARPLDDYYDDIAWTGNFKSWVQNRKLMEISR